MKTLLTIVALFTALSAHAQHDHHHMTDRPSVHGMLMVGTSKIYLSHLPMFMSPHDYQVIFEVELPAQALKTYLDAHKSNPGEKVYTLVPETFVLPEMVASPRPFKAQLFQGHFERGGTPITNKVTVSIKKVLYFKKFDPAAQRPASYEAIVFGDSHERFLAHKISAKPDFDQVLQVQAEGMADDQVLELPLNDVGAQQPLKEGEARSGLEVLKEFYLEFGDLS